MDPNQLAKSVVDEATAEDPPAPEDNPQPPKKKVLVHFFAPPPELEKEMKTESDEGVEPEPGEESPPGKNPNAVALGSLGGKKGGKARAESLSKERRSEIARKAAEARWKKKKK